MATNEFPLMIAHMRIKQSHLSPYSCSMLEGQQMKYPSKVKKTCSKSFAAEKYLFMVKHLWLLMSQGLEIDTVHKVCRYRREAYMKEFIQRNIDFRRQGTSKQRKSIKCKYAREISLNATCFILLRQRDVCQIEILEQIFGSKKS